MTAAEKRERRRVKHSLRAAVLAKHFHQFKLCATNNQLKQFSKQVADQILAGKNPQQVVRLP